MRRGSKLTGLKSKFSRAVRKAKAFFGWRDHDDEGDQEALAQAVAAQETAEATAEKPKHDDDGGDGAPAGRRLPSGRLSPRPPSSGR